VLQVGVAIVAQVWWVEIVVLVVVVTQVRGCEIEVVRSQIEHFSYYSPPWSLSSSSGR
jgi:hypothetical protein